MEENRLGTFVESQFLSIHHNIGAVQKLVGIRNPGELGDETGVRLRVEDLPVSLLTDRKQRMIGICFRG